MTVTAGMTTEIKVHEKEPKAMRHEIKYNINSIDDRILSERLRKLFLHDRHADSHGSYRVSSLYFDTPYDKALKEKMVGVKSREKFRIRYYGDDMSFIRLEKKYKNGDLCAKRSAALTYEEVRDIMKGRIAFLAEREDGLLVEFYSKLKGQLLKPKTVVTYEREAFLYAPGNVRMTIDRDLRSGMADAAFPADRKKLVSMSDDLRVLEVKYDSFLPDIVKIAVQGPDRRRTAFSKYAVCRRYD